MRGGNPRGPAHKYLGAPERREETKAGNPVEVNTISKNWRAGVSKLKEDYWIPSISDWKDIY